MRLAIHKNNGGFTDRWIDYCARNGIEYGLVDCYDSDIIKQLQGYDALLWHHSHISGKDLKIAKPILFALEHAGFKVFPDWKSNWHFNDKVAQKYLFEAMGIPMVPSYVFTEKQTALKWAASTTYPKVWKLRAGAGSSHVRLVKSERDCKRLIRRSFGKGFPYYNSVANLKERIRKWRTGKTDLGNVVRGMVRLIDPPYFSRMAGREKGYIYFQDFLPDNAFDIRVIVVGDKAFALKRMVRKKDFRASGSGEFRVERQEFDEGSIALSFEIAKKIGTSVCALDYVYDENASPLVVEVSFGFTPYAYDSCPGYWDDKLHWYEGPFDPYGWMIDDLKIGK